MLKKLLTVTLLLLFCAHSFGQIDLNEYTFLKSEGKMPADFKKYLRSETKENQLLKRLFSNGMIFYGTELNQYVDKIADQLLKDHPDLRAKMRFYILNSNNVNAFAFSDHIILVSLGLLAQVQNESELAFIISHELIHIVNNHIEKERIVVKKNPKYNSDKDQALVYHNRSRDHEYESDKEGFIKFYEKSGYNLDAINGVFDVLLYDYLPFDEVKLDRNFLETTFYKFPDSHFLVNLTPIRSREDFIDTLSTHPNILKRRTIINNLVENSNTPQGSVFIQPDSLFYKVRSIARFECLNNYLRYHDYAHSFYNAYALLQEYPNNEFLEQVLVTSLYGLSKHKNSDGIKDVVPSYKDGEGEIQQVFHLFTKMNRDESALLAIRFSYQASLKYPKNSYFPSVVNDLMQDLHNRRRLNYADYSDYPMNYDVTLIPKDTVETESTQTQTPKNRFEKIKSNVKKTKVIPIETFKTHNYMLVDLRQDSAFMELVESNLKVIEDKEILGAIDERKFDHKVCNSMIVWNPKYLLKTKDGSYKAKNEMIEKMVHHSIKEQKVQAVEVSDYVLSNLSTEKYNHFCKIQNFYTDYIYSNGIPMLYYESNHIEDACLDFGGSCINFINAYETRSSSLKGAYFLFVPPAYFLFPFAPQLLIHSLIKHKETRVEYRIVNMISSEVIAQKTAVIEGKNNIPAVNVFINRMYNQYSPKKGSSK